MKKLIISLVVCAPLLLAAPVNATPNSQLYNPELRTDVLHSGATTLPKAGASYAYWHRNYHRWHRGYGYHRWHHYNHYHRHYHRHYRW